MTNSDPRYEQVKCASCGRVYQRMDFRGNPHVFLCERPEDLSDKEAFRRQQLSRGDDGASVFEAA